MNWILHQLIFPLEVFMLANCVLLIDFFQKGWQESAARRLWMRGDNERKDLIWFIASITGLIRGLAFLFTLGAAFWIPKLLHWRQPACHWPEWVQFCFAGFSNEFLFYWGHRALHRWFWFAHRTHHLPTRFNGITVFRTHPFEVALMNPLLSAPTVLLGVSPRIAAAWGLCRFFHDIMIHSEVSWLPRWVSEWIIVDGRQHAQHHSCEPEDYNCKFGLLPIFDRLFGTWKPLPDGKIKIGIKNDEYK